MSAAATIAAPCAVDPLDASRLRTWARAHLYREGELDLTEAVDELQSNAERDGLVRDLGQDAVQRMLTEAFTPARAEEIPDNIEAEPVDAPRAAESTVEALAYSLRTHGADALRDMANQHRLTELSDRQIKALIARLARMRGSYSAITEELLLLLAEVLP